MLEKVLLAFSTFPDAETARRISKQLVEEKLAACANIFPAIESIYRWKGKIETGQEMIAFFKTSEDRQCSFSGEIALSSSLRAAGNNFRPDRGRIARISSLGGRELP